MSPPLRRRTLERGTAAAVAIFGGIVSAESLTHDVAWNDTGPGPGYFPFRIGLLLIGGAAVLLWQARRADAGAVFATGEELRRSLGVLWPTALLVAGTFALGVYLPSALYLTFMMRTHGRYGWLPCAACGAAAMAVFFVVFELWLAVPLAKGPLEALLRGMFGA